MINAAAVYQPGKEKKESTAKALRREKIIFYFKKRVIEFGIKVGKTTAVSLGRRNSSHRFGQRTKGASVVVTADAEEMLQSYECDGMDGMKISVWTDSI